MIRHGNPPYLECSSRGEKRLSAFHARIVVYGGKSVEEVYQAHKVFSDGATGLHWRDAKGRAAVNMEECDMVYGMLWDAYINEHPELLALIKKAPGLQDTFGQPGRCCQATELWRIRNAR